MVTKPDWVVAMHELEEYGKLMGWTSFAETGHGDLLRTLISDHNRLHTKEASWTALHVPHDVPAGAGRSEGGGAVAEEASSVR
jgi:hypothetical protein